MTRLGHAGHALAGLGNPPRQHTWGCARRLAPPQAITSQAFSLKHVGSQRFTPPKTARNRSLNRKSFSPRNFRKCGGAEEKYHDQSSPSAIVNHFPIENGLGGRICLRGAIADQAYSRHGPDSPASRDGCRAHRSGCSPRDGLSPHLELPAHPQFLHRTAARRHLPGHGIFLRVRLKVADTKWWVLSRCDKTSPRRAGGSAVVKDAPSTHPPPESSRRGVSSRNWDSFPQAVTE